MIFFLSPAELSHRLEERDSMIGQLQRSKAAIIQNHEDLKKQQEEESKVTTDLNEDEAVFVQMISSGLCGFRLASVWLTLCSRPATTAVC